MEVIESISAKFAVNISKSAKHFAKFTGKDSFRPQFSYVAMQPGKGIMAVTNGNILQVVNIHPQGEYPEDITIFVDPKHISKIAGRDVTMKVTEVSAGERQITEIMCGGSTYTTEAGKIRFPDVMRVVPKEDSVHVIEFTTDSLAGLWNFCKITDLNRNMVLCFSEGSTSATVYTEEMDHTFSFSCSVLRLKLARPSEITSTIYFNPELLATVLNGCNGKLGIIDSSRAVKIYGEADETIIMPKMPDGWALREGLRSFAGTSPSDSTFTEDSAAVIEELQTAAQRYWGCIVMLHTKEGKCSLISGNYRAADVDKYRPGKHMDRIYVPGHEEPLTIEVGNIRMEVPYREIFSVLTKWEKIGKAKSIFKVGQVEEVTAAVLNPSGDSVDECNMKLRKLGSGWYSPVKRGVKDWDAPVYCEVNGHIIYVGRIPLDVIDDADKFAAWSEGKAAQIPAKMTDAAKENIYFAELCEKTGIEVSGAITRKDYDARCEAERIRQQEEDRLHKEEILRREAERKEAEERRNAELLATGKRKLLSGERITVEQLEIIANAVGYKINIRTLGTMRKRLVCMSYSEENGWNYSFHCEKNTPSRSFNGAMAVVKELYECLKAQCDNNVPAAHELGCIHAGPAEAVNVSSETPQTAECIAEDYKSDAKYAPEIAMLKIKFAKLKKEEHKYDDRNMLSRKLYYSDAKRQVRIGEQCTAIEAALKILNGKQWHELDIYNIVLMSVNSRNSEKAKMLDYAYSGELSEKAKALIFAFETSLPICKKQTFNAMRMQIKYSRLARST